MPEPTTITVAQEVEAILAVQAANYQASASVLGSEAGAFYLEVAAALRGILEEYQAPAPAPAPEDREWQVGDRIRLTGSEWSSTGNSFSTGDVVTITRVKKYYGGERYFTEDSYGDEWYVIRKGEDPDDDYEYYGGELVAAADDEIRVGDTVRINERYGAELNLQGHVGEEFTVTQVVDAEWTDLRGNKHKFYVHGDRMGRGIWDRFVEKVYK